MTVAESWRLMRLFARQERTLAIRSRWTPIFAVVFAGLALGVGTSGYILTGGAGMQDFARTAVSLVQLVLLLVPLTALLIGVVALSPDRGAAELLFAQPVPRRVVLVGKVIGLFEALAAAQLIGFGAAGLAVFSRVGGGGGGGFALMVLGSLALTGIFLGIAGLISVANVGRRTRALALALVVWFATVVLFDVVALAVANLLRSGHASRWLVTAVLVNPVDAIRTGVLLGVEGSAAFGAASLAFFRITGGSTWAAVYLGGSVIMWLLLPMALAVRRLEKADL
jgi:Cu-processing system permease protein